MTATGAIEAEWKQALKKAAAGLTRVVAAIIGIIAPILIVMSSPWPQRNNSLPVYDGSWLIGQKLIQYRELHGVFPSASPSGTLKTERLMTPYEGPAPTPTDYFKSVKIIRNSRAAQVLGSPYFYLTAGSFAIGAIGIWQIIRARRKGERIRNSMTDAAFFGFLFCVSFAACLILREGYPEFRDVENRDWAADRALFYAANRSRAVLQSIGPDGKRDLGDIAILLREGKTDVVAYAYDPTNGALSGGDLFYVVDRR